MITAQISQVNPTTSSFFPLFNSLELWNMFKKLKPLDIVILNRLFAWDNQKTAFDFYQGYIADRVAGCTRETINKRIALYTELGILRHWGQRYDKHTYTMNPIFHETWVRELLSGLVETFRRFPKIFRFSLCLITPIITNKRELRREAYEASAFEDQTAWHSYLDTAQPLRGNAQAPQGMPSRGNAPPSTLEKKPLNGIEERPSWAEASDVAGCDEYCQKGSHFPWCF